MINTIINVMLMFSGLFGGIYYGISEKMSVDDARIMFKYGCICSLVTIGIFYIGTLIGFSVGNSLKSIVMLDHVGFGALLVPLCYAMIIFSVALFCAIKFKSFWKS